MILHVKASTVLLIFTTRIIDLRVFILCFKGLVVVRLVEAYLELLPLQQGCLDPMSNQLLLQVEQLGCLEQQQTQGLEHRQSLHLALVPLVLPTACLVSLKPNQPKPPRFLDSKQHKPHHLLVLDCLGRHLLAALWERLALPRGPLAQRLNLIHQQGQTRWYSLYLLQFSVAHSYGSLMFLLHR